MNFNDTIITRADATVDDEFERDVLHRGSTISLNWTVYSLFVLGAALSWILEGFASSPQPCWSFLRSSECSSASGGCVDASRCPARWATRGSIGCSGRSS
ncbi:hypothetical protein QP028_01660 [Corynebacterium suedekumii]|nr:hypothetical protein QP028_01660 [Corynebacterium suedekumii]